MKKLTIKFKGEFTLDEERFNWFLKEVFHGSSDDKQGVQLAKENTPEEKFTDIELREALIKALKKLEKVEALIIQLYYVEELNVYEIAKILDLTNGRISQIKSIAIKKLRDEIKNII